MRTLSPDTLRGFVPFQVLSLPQLEELSGHCSRLYVRKERAITEPGRGQQSACFLLSGTARLKASGEILTAAFRYPLHFRHTKLDTVVAETDCSLFQVDRETLDKFLCWSQVSRYLETDFAFQRQSDEQAEWVKKILNSNLFYKVPPLNIQRVFSYLVPMPVSKGQVILRQGEVGDGCYFIKQGAALVTRKNEHGGAPEVLAEIGVGRCFGEDALVHETVRNASVTMLSDGMLMKMEKRDFVQLLREPTVDMLSNSDLDMALQTGAKLLDVRTLDEYEYEHLKGALSMPLELMRLKARMLDHFGTYVVYCDTDRRSRAAAWLLEQQGLRARALAGGLAALSPVQKESLRERM